MFQPIRMYHVIISTYSTCYVSTNVCLTQAGSALLSLDTARTSANLMRKVATTAKMARDTASVRRRSMMEGELALL